LSKAGVGFYSLALLANKVALVSQAIKLAAYTHGMLVVHMIITNQVCPACVLTAVGAVIAATE